MKVFSRVPPVQEFARRTEEHVKALIVPGALFEEFGFNYVGPIDGHDLNALLPTLKNLKRLGGPQLLHVVTRKGKGYAPAESDPVKYHGISSPFDPAVGIVSGPKPGTAQPTYSQVFGDWLCDMAERDERLVAITPAMREGSKMERFEQHYPERYFDVAIAEQHSVTFAAGLACEGMKPVVAIYSTFLQRAYDQVVHDVVIQDLPVMLAIDRAGVVGGDGPTTHAGAYDVTYLRCLPNIVVMTPADENETRRMLCTGFLHDGPSAVRYPRGAGPGVPVERDMQAVPIGKAEERRRGAGIAFLSFGPLLHHVMEVAEGLDATVFNMRFVKPLDEEAVLSLARDHELLVTVEENALGGAGGAVANVSRPMGWRADCCRSGFPIGSSSTAAVTTCSPMRGSIPPESPTPSTIIVPDSMAFRTANDRPIADRLDHGMQAMSPAGTCCARTHSVAARTATIQTTFGQARPAGAGEFFGLEES